MLKLIFALCIFSPLVAGKSIIPTYYNVPGMYNTYPTYYSNLMPTHQTHGIFHKQTPIEGQYIHSVPQYTLKSAFPGTYIPHHRVAPVTQGIVPINHAPLTVPISHTPLTVPISHTPLTVPIQHTFHSQDGLGGYSFGYYGGPDSRVEHKDQFGNVVGAYNYVDPEGKVQSAQYTAGKGGFNIAATNIPKPTARQTFVVEDTEEVKMAKEEFNKAFQAAKTKRTKREAVPAFQYSHSVVAPSVFGVPKINLKPITYSTIQHVPQKYTYKTEEEETERMDEEEQLTKLTHKTVEHKPIDAKLVSKAYPTLPHNYYNYNPFVQNVQYPAGVSHLNFRHVPQQPIVYHGVQHHTGIQHHAGVQNHFGIQHQSGVTPIFYHGLQHPTGVSPFIYQNVHKTGVIPPLKVQKV